MISIKDIIEYKTKALDEIFSIANKIHPKLLRRLSFQDIMNQDFDAETYYNAYIKDVRPLIWKYYSTFDQMVDSHMYDFLNGWLLLNPEEHFGIKLSTGEYLTRVPTDPISTLYNDVLIDVNLEKYWEFILALKSDSRVKAYWEYEGYITGNSQHRYIHNVNSGVLYIKQAREAFNGVKSTYEIIGDISTTINKIPYPIRYPAMDRAMESLIKNSEFHSVITHHSVLYEFFEKYGKDAQNGIYEFTKNKFTRLE